MQINNILLHFLETDCHYQTMKNGHQCLASGFELIAEDVECEWSDLDKVARSTLGGGDHGESGCYHECEIRGDNCNFYAYKKSTGYCHMFKTCYKQTTNDGYKLYRKKPSTKNVFLLSFVCRFLLCGKFVHPHLSILMRKNDQNWNTLNCFFSIFTRFS